MLRLELSICSLDTDGKYCLKYSSQGLLSIDEPKISNCGQLQLMNVQENLVFVSAGRKDRRCTLGTDLRMNNGIAFETCNLKVKQKAEDKAG